MSRQKTSAPARLRWMHDRLAAYYGPQHWWPAETAFETIVGAYLTQNTAWKAVERSLENLQAAGALTVDGLRALPMEELRRAIRPSGFYTRKAPALKAFVAMLDAEFAGQLEAMAAEPTPALRKRLLGLPGVGPETADAVLLYALGHAVPVADEYLRRIAERHGLIAIAESKAAPARGKAGGRGSIGYDAMAELTRQAFATEPATDWARLFNEFHALTVAVGKAHCGRTARCEGCPLKDDLRRG